MPPFTQECLVDLDYEQKDAFKEFKDLVSKAPVLNYFSKSGPTGRQEDASKDGFGFLLLQHCQPVTYISGALSVADSKYSQVIFGVGPWH